MILAREPSFEMISGEAAYLGGPTRKVLFEVVVFEVVLAKSRPGFDVLPELHPARVGGGLCESLA